MKALVSDDDARMLTASHEPWEPLLARDLLNERQHVRRLQRHIDDLCVAIQRGRQRHGIRRFEMRTQIEELRAWIRKQQWCITPSYRDGHEPSQCPECGFDREEGHSPEAPAFGCSVPRLLGEKP